MIHLVFVKTDEPHRLTLDSAWTTQVAADQRVKMLGGTHVNFTLSDNVELSATPTKKTTKKATTKKASK